MTTPVIIVRPEKCIHCNADLTHIKIPFKSAPGQHPTMTCLCPDCGWRFLLHG